MNISTFRQQFKQLSPIEQDMLKLLAIAYEQVNQTTMQNLLKDAGVRQANGNQILGTQIKEYRDLLNQTGWLRLGEKAEMRVAAGRLELVMRMAVIDKRFKTMVQLIQKEFPYKDLFHFRPSGLNACLREMRIALYDGDMSHFGEVLLNAVTHFREEWEKVNFFGEFFSPFDPGWLRTFPENIQELSISHLLAGAFDRLEEAQQYELFALEAGWLNGEKPGELVRQNVLMCYLFQGRHDALRRIIEKEQLGYEKTAWLGVTAFLTGKDTAGLTLFQDALKMYRKQEKRQSLCLPGIPGLIHGLACLKYKGMGLLKELHALAGYAKTEKTGQAMRYLSAAAYFQENLIPEATELLKTAPETPLEWLFFAIVHYWNEQQLNTSQVDKLKQWKWKAQTYGYRRLEMEFASLLAHFEEDKRLADGYSILSNDLQAELGMKPFMALLPHIRKWERSLEALRNLRPAARHNDGDGKYNRLSWWVDFKNHLVQPVEQTYGKGGWSKGRHVALKRLKEGTVSNMTEQDKAAAAAVKLTRTGFYGNAEYWLDFEKLLPALIGHPLLFLLDNPAIPVELIEQKPQLLVEQKGSEFELKFSHDFNRAGMQLLRETPTRYVVLVINETHLEINRLLDFGQLRIPAQAKEQLIETVGNLSAIVTVQSEIGGGTSGLQTIEGQSTPHLHLLPVGDGFKLEFFVKPFAEGGPYFKPGKGRSNVIADISGTPTRARRNLAQELENVRKVEEACPSLLNATAENLEWLLDDIESCLSVLLELQPLRENGTIILEHPKGEKLRISGQVGFGGISLGVKKERNWFEVSGQVQVNENLVMDFRQLLELTQKSQGNFVEIGDGQFLALTAGLRQKLDEMNALFSKNQKELRFHPLAAHIFDDFSGLLRDFEVDAAWQQQLARLSEARNLHPAVPAAFKAEMRTYQQEGFRWLSQLAHWGVGACLADDMGLGKTIQALAVLLDRAKQGPALVVAPASVVRNWYHETHRFAPDLKPQIFGDGDRRETMKGLGPFDLLLCSYGLMQQESEMLTAMKFTTIVLDEAQAIKNRATKRSQTAMELQGDFKIITTGTPIENHLGEIWNLFNFLNPGLLGSLQHFNETYAAPIEKYQDEERREQLRRLIQPFILRRRKRDVLTELPEKTEVTLSVELSEEERAFYEALRREAIKNIEQSGVDISEKRFQILAELMRLRQACCHPRMVAPDSELPSAKLNLFADTVEELLAEGHKALVFSQFVKHLKILEEWVKARGIRYQYLDGSTSMAQREKAIQSFQSGDGDLFLISLKAGGFGLNLTAADYVLHLDPWWNPAVEDQASDRAHRIGQQRPVTIYRLVAANTIEEKIVKLHADKRELADSLLEGTEVSGKLNANELLALIKG
ncbi:MAG: DEAD/DEAH box helicase [Saprospiraceae bacterium]|nr:MAG: DEAD/DEAH box helicase [Saprospiraceae bacterium]